MYNNKPGCKKGRIELITGCMFAGKTEELIRRLIMFSYGKYHVQAFKPSFDDRYNVENVVSHNHQEIKAIPIAKSTELLHQLDPKTEVVGIDEVQFFDEGIVNVIEQLANDDKIVIVSGLDKDFRNQPFRNVQELLVKAEEIVKLHAICVKCGSLANSSQRMNAGHPVLSDEPILLLGEKDRYEARCRHCYESKVK